MATEYMVIQFERNSSFCTRLISTDDFKDYDGPLEDFFEPDCTDIKDAGRIQIVGDTDLLGDRYIEER